MAIEKRFLNTEEAAAYLGLSIAQLEKARTQGRGGPPYVKPPGVRRILYDVRVLENWMEQGQRESTAEPEPPKEGRRLNKAGQGGGK